ncbi:MAG: hypothetical protein LAQ30_05645 [Acidobacteriia bacterium]|nr:hypothetical protein [Terriglobia bacterium]
MKKLIAMSALGASLSICALAEQWTGVIMDQKCSSNKEMRTNASCAEACIKQGSPAVLVTDDGTIYAISNQKKVTSHAGQKVTVTGKLESGNTITVDNVK